MDPATRSAGKREGGGVMEQAQAEEKILNALEVQSIPSSPAVRKRVRELLARDAFETVMGWVFTNQTVFTTTTSQAPAPTWSSAPRWTGSAPQSSPVSMETSAAAEIEPPQEPGKAPLSDADIQTDRAVFMALPEAERKEVRQLVDTDKALARLTGQLLFGIGHAPGSFVCPKCGSRSPGTECKDGMRTMRFQCGACKTHGSLFDFEAWRNGRKSAIAEDFQTVEAVAFAAYSS